MVVNEDLRVLVKQKCKENEVLVFSIARELYDNPEEGFKEQYASNLLVSVLERHGFEKIERGIAGLPTAFLAGKEGRREDGPIVALLAEYDALPGIGHGCGHNLIAAASTGAAIALVPALKNIGGTLLVVGCPAEEAAVDNAGGKVILLEAGVFDKVDAALMFHPADKTRLAMATCAREALIFSFHGKAAHAATAPEQGINALAAAINTFVAWNSLRPHLPRSVQLHGIITEGGKAPNIIPDFAQIKAYVRAPDDSTLAAAVQKVKKSAAGAASALGATLEVTKAAHRFKHVISNKVLAGIFREELKRQGIEENETVKDAAASTDMGNISHVVPAIHPQVQICKPGIPLHTPSFRDATITTNANRALAAVTSALAFTVLELFLDPSLLEAARRELQQRNS